MQSIECFKLEAREIIADIPGCRIILEASSAISGRIVGFDPTSGLYISRTMVPLEAVIDSRQRTVIKKAANNTNSATITIFVPAHTIVFVDVPPDDDSVLVSTKAAEQGVVFRRARVVGGEIHLL